MITIQWHTSISNQIPQSLTLMASSQNPTSFLPVGTIWAMPASSLLRVTTLLGDFTSLMYPH